MDFAFIMLKKCLSIFLTSVEELTWLYLKSLVFGNFKLFGNLLKKKFNSSK